MSMATFPIRESTDTLWERYSSLVQQCLDDPRLWADRHHQETLIRAHKRYADAYLAEGIHAQAG